MSLSKGFTLYPNGRLHPSAKATIKKVLGYKECQKCKISFSALKPHNVHIHHIDENHTNQDVNNLTLLCVTCHMRHHKKGNRNNHSISMEDESDLCEAYATGLFTQKHLARYHGVHVTTVENLLRRSRL